MEVVPAKIDDEASARRFIASCIKIVGLGYHPDTPFRDYVADDGSRCFSDAEARNFEEATQIAFRYCHPYSVALDAAQRLLGITDQQTA